MLVVAFDEMQNTDKKTSQIVSFIIAEALISRLAVKLVEELGISLAETACQLGVSTSAISKIMRKYEDDKCI